MFFSSNDQLFLRTLLFLGLWTTSPSAKAVVSEQAHITEQAAEQPLAMTASESVPNAPNVHLNTGTQKNNLPPIWLAFPFLLLLLMLATGPLLYAHYWHKYYPKIAILLAAFVITYYLFVQHNFIKPIEALVEYIQFIALIASLYMASGGILIELNKQATPRYNVGLLLTGALLSNLIGTTGASMLLIRPYIRLNQHKIKVYHIAFFIFMVSNVGGSLTPIGDPPLFLGFLSGVPFCWTLEHNFLPWLLALLLLSLFFYVLDTSNLSGSVSPVSAQPTFKVLGKRNFIWLFLIITAVLLDPNVFDWVPALHYHGHTFSFVRELIMLSVAWYAYRHADKEALKGNDFNFAPLREVVLIFIGIFGTMIPALELISAFAQSETGRTLITHNTLYWGTGFFSSILDNAPTYLNFSAASMAAQGAAITCPADVQAYALGTTFTHSVLRLKAISIASVFFGAMTYIGNGPNFMVKSIAEQLGIQMPSFFGYILRFSIPLLLPTLFIIWLLFFAFA